MQSLKKYVRGGVIALFLMALASLLTYNSISAAAPATSTAPVRGYYLTKGNVVGSAALTACVSGYHMASFGEVIDPSNLSYRRTLGRTAADSGFGPPLAAGWVRSGSSAAVSGVGANCNAWTSSSSSDHGIVAATGALTTAGIVFDTSAACDGSGFNIPGPGVWCVEN